MTPEGRVCWKCGASLEDLPRSFGRRDECPACRADLHVCRMCRHFDPRVSKACREPVAEAVQDKERSNFCDWFQERAGAGPSPSADPGAAAREALEALFGVSGAQTPDAASAPVPNSREATRSEADAARAALDRLFASPAKDG
ncbi:MAG: hypothetical protein MUF66_01755 [Gammaproteobacteria bacterium]|nr:hypothetical protein [Gammaproteobacteria bacterium]